MVFGSKHTRKSSIPPEKAKKYRAIANLTPSLADPNSPVPAQSPVPSSPVPTSTNAASPEGVSLEMASPQRLEGSEPALSSPNTSFYNSSPKRFSFWSKNTNSPKRGESEFSIQSPSVGGDSEAGDSVTQEGSQKLKYKKKLRRATSSHYMKHMADISAGKFQVSLLFSPSLSPLNKPLH